MSHVRQATYVNEQKLLDITSSVRHRISFLQNLEIPTTTIALQFRAVDIYLAKLKTIMAIIERLQMGFLPSVLVSPEEL